MSSLGYDSNRDAWIRMEMASTPEQIDDCMLQLRRWAWHMLPLANRVQLCQLLMQDIVNQVEEHSVSALPLDFREAPLRAAFERLIHARLNRTVELSEEEALFFGIVPEPNAPAADATNIDTATQESE